MTSSSKDGVLESPGQRMPAASASSSFPAFSSLTIRQQQFVLHYLSGPTMGEQTLSYLAAGYKAGRNVRLCAYRLRTSPKVKAAMLELLRVAGITRERVIEVLGRLVAGASPADFQQFVNGEVTLQELVDRGVNMAAVAKVHVTIEKDGSEHRAVELWDPIPALKLAARLVGMTGGQASANATPGLDLSTMTPDELQRLRHALGDD